MAKTFPETHPHRQLLHNLAQTLLCTRGEDGLSRKKLAELSGLSERFLADVEAEIANPSLESLSALAEALELTVPQMVAGNWVPTPRLGALLVGMSADEQEKLADVIEARARKTRLKVALVGVRGAGKTTVGRLVAKERGCAFVELDHLVEQRAELPLKQLFEVHGEEVYRRYEREALRETLSDEDPAVIATGGGLVSDPETFGLLLAGARTVWLKARPQDYLARVLRQGDKRPMDRRPQALTELTALLRKREPAYARSELTIETGGLSPSEVASRILTWLDKPAGARPGGSARPHAGARRR